MKNSVFAFLVAAFLCTPCVHALTIQIAGGGELIAVGDTWKFFRGTVDPSTPLDAWWKKDFVDTAWEQGPTGIGYDDGDDATIITGMQDNYLTIYTRKEFTLDAIPAGAVELEIDYDDGFVAYLNDVEIARRGIAAGAVTRTTTATSHDAGTPEKIALGAAADVLDVGKNVLAIEIHNTSLGSGDLSLIPALRIGGSAVEDGNHWIVTSDTVSLRGTAASTDVAFVALDGTDVAFNAADRTWQGSVTLAPGFHTVTAEGLNSSRAVVETAAMTILYLPPEAQQTHVGGTLAGDTTWSGVCIVDSGVIVPAGVTLTVAPGTAVRFASAASTPMGGATASLLVYGRLIADGTAAAPILFTRYAAGTLWRRIIFVEAADSRFAYATFEYANTPGDHQDYYNPNPDSATGEAVLRNYHEMLVVLASHVDWDYCTFQKLGQADVMAIVADDPTFPAFPEYPGHAGPTSANIRHCRFVGVGQGVHTRKSYVLVENCYFVGKTGDNDDVDLYGENTLYLVDGVAPPPMIRNNLFDLPVEEDRVNPTKCSAIVMGNIIKGSGDHGIVLRDAGFPIAINNVISNCPNGGIAVENTSSALLVNNTIYDCDNGGLKLFDLGRAGFPYYLAAGGGTAIAINCVVRECTRNISLEDSSNTAAPDRGSHLTVIHCNIQGGQAGARVSGTYSTLTWGVGNIDVDPRFVSVPGKDFSLQSTSPCIDAGTSENAPATDVLGTSRPCGAAIDMGAYEYCEGEPVTRFRRGDPNDDGRIDLSDAVSVLLYLFRSGREPGCLKSADANDDGALSIADAVALLDYLFAHGAALPVPFSACGTDPTADTVTCTGYTPCQ